MTDQDFFFALDVSGDPEFDQMLAEVARTVLGQVGYTAPVIDALTGQLRSALADRVDGGTRRCDVRFESKNGQLQIVVAGAGRPEWRTTWPIPSA